MAHTGRPLDIVLLGATGYTGKYCVENIVKHHPTNLKWAIAGRSPDKLHALAAELQKEAPDRVAPEILPVQMNDEELGNLARKAKVLINCVGPYHIYSSPVVAACANNGTHYVDMTGEVPWIKEMISKHHETAKSKGAILMSAVGFESAPFDILSWAMAHTVQEKYGVLTKEATMTLYDAKSAGASGGTLATALTTINDTPTAELKAARSPHYLVLNPRTAAKPAPFLRRLLGVHNVPHIGTVTTSFSAGINVPIVQRGSSLLPNLYSPDFRYWEYLRVPDLFLLPGFIVGIVTHFALAGGMGLLALSPVRWMLEKIVTTPGQGPSKARTEGNRIELRGIATGDKDGKPAQAMGKLVYESDAYSLTGIVATEAAMVLLQNDDLVKELGGGYLTPGMLGQAYVDRLQGVGLKIDTDVLE